nr:cellular tumor antigen p53 isoform X2 [Parasteatoda tepidariorum]XP_042897196.1 cellular tumor antigen p53 isoform X2 [Parasteatoda tepidariorum]XP_042897197.1 cellular tumor antigen p53 isoform X2 [Parasteatoda tepidariorum]XP_042897198.1 cellular tumor antigen p53 isoform X2 [Parasteatoda tepidariorum]XP_042897199.1 cellular tumor antigen p53 isoform X2 [Parasteatoda tepidariorum]XP_042897200.1 cellular tumor antigen p53 isoform X2 [Parasteatoda tepidariorum]XP_042897201.1 cellular tumor
MAERQQSKEMNPASNLQDEFSNTFVSFIENQSPDPIEYGITLNELNGSAYINELDLFNDNVLQNTSGILGEAFSTDVFVNANSVSLSHSQVLDNDHFNNLSVQNNYNNREVVPVELIETNNVPQVASSVPLAPSSLPASQNWPGDYNFNVSFSQQEKSTKGVSWTYSKSLDKLYVGKDAPCPINFSTNTLMPENVKIRAIALYSSPESASEVVVRCVNHSLEEKSKNIFEAEHLVRCESSNVSYDIDPSTRRHSVLVPFENPPAGQLFSTYIYKFTCFGSCPFGPNRRPLMLVFTLEKGNQVLGRRKVDVKICACPGRDRKSDEQQASALEIGSSKKRKEPEFVSLSETMEFTKNVMLPVSKKSRHSQYGEGPYRLVVEDYECFEFLKQMKKLYDFSKIVKNIHPEMRKVLVHNQ